MLPIAAAGGVVVRAAPAVIAAARQTATRIFQSTPSVVDVVAKRTGVVGGAKKILEAMSSNRLVTSLVLLDLGIEGASLLTELAAADPEVAEMVRRYGWAPDPVKEDVLGDLVAQAEELDAISEAADIVGGVSRLQALRRALSLSDKHFKLYDSVRTIGRGLAG